MLSVPPTLNLFPLFFSCQCNREEGSGLGFRSPSSGKVCCASGKFGYTCNICAGNLHSLEEGKSPFQLLWHHELPRLWWSCGKVSIFPTTARESPPKQEPVIIDCVMRVFVENDHTLSSLRMTTPPLVEGATWSFSTKSWCGP